MTKRIVISQYSSLHSIYQHFNFCATWNLLPVVTTGCALQSSIKMAYFTDVERAKRALQFKQNHSATMIQGWFRTYYYDETRTLKSIHKCHKSFAETGCICAKKKNSGRWLSDETVKHVRASFLCYPQKSTRRESKELGDVLHLTVWKVQLSFRSYKFQVLQELTPNGRPRRRDFCADMLNRLEQDNLFFGKTVFTDEATVHLSGKVNGHYFTCRWQNLHQFVEYVRDSQKLNCFLYY
jgi:hypothetical protein